MPLRIAFTDQAILLDENLLLLEQHNGQNTRKLIKAAAVEKAKVLSYEDIVEATRNPTRWPKRKSPTQVLKKRSASRVSSGGARDQAAENGGVYIYFPGIPRNIFLNSL